MENLMEMHEEEVVSPEEFQGKPDPNQRDSSSEGEEQDESGYTPGETEYADGEGTRLDQEMETSEEDED